jgi:hypothetical protein
MVIAREFDVFFLNVPLLLLFVNWEWVARVVQRRRQESPKMEMVR